MKIHNLKLFHFLHWRILLLKKFSIIFFIVILVSLSMRFSAQASDPQIVILNSWVEDGYIFHVDFEVQPYQVFCKATGAGYIGFNVHYNDSRTSKVDWTFGLAPWPGISALDDKVKSHLTAYGPQAFCTKFSPCIIQTIQVVKTWCPISE